MNAMLLFINMNIIDYIIQQTGLKQRKIAEELGVSPALITKWKQAEWTRGKPSGVNISDDQLEKLEELSGIKDVLSDHGGVEDIDWVLIVDGKKANAQDWYDYLGHFYDELEENWEEYATIITPHILKELKNLGISIPANPKDLEGEKEEDDEVVWGPLATLLASHSEDYAARESWYYRYMDPHGAVDAAGERSSYLWDYFENLKWTGWDISLAMIGEECFEELGADIKKLREYKQKTESEALRYLDMLLKEMISCNIPFKHDYFRFIFCDGEDLLDDSLFRGVYHSMKDYIPYKDQLTHTSLASIEPAAEKTYAVSLLGKTVELESFAMGSKGKVEPSTLSSGIVSKVDFLRNKQTDSLMVEITVDDQTYPLDLVKSVTQ